MYNDRLHSNKVCNYNSIRMSTYKAEQIIRFSECAIGLLLWFLGLGLLIFNRKRTLIKVRNRYLLGSFMVMNLIMFIQLLVNTIIPFGEYDLAIFIFLLCSGYWNFYFINAILLWFKYQTGDMILNNTTISKPFSKVRKVLKNQLKVFFIWISVSLLEAGFYILVFYLVKENTPRIIFYELLTTTIAKGLLVFCCIVKLWKACDNYCMKRELKAIVIFWTVISILFIISIPLKPYFDLSYITVPLSIVGSFMFSIILPNIMIFVKDRQHNRDRSRSDSFTLNTPSVNNSTYSIDAPVDKRKSTSVDRSLLFSKILINHEWKLAFTEHLKKSFKVELLYIMQDIQEYKLIQESMRQMKLRFIWEKYLVEDSYMQLDFNFKLDFLEPYVGDDILEIGIPANIFDPIEQFVLSTLFKEFCEWIILTPEGKTISENAAESEILNNGIHHFEESFSVFYPTSRSDEQHV